MLKIFTKVQSLFTRKSNNIITNELSSTKKAFLQNYNNSHDDLLQNTFEIMENL